MCLDKQSLKKHLQQPRREALAHYHGSIFGNRGWGRVETLGLPAPGVSVDQAKPRGEGDARGHTTQEEVGMLAGVAGLLAAMTVCACERARC